MAKRPSAASIRSKQHQVLRYIYSTSFKETSEDYNVSTRKLRQFVKANPKRIKSRVIKDSAYQSLYKTDVKQVAKKNKTKLIPKLSRKRYFDIQKKIEQREPVTVRELLAREYRTSTKQREYTKSESGKITYRPISPRQEQMQEARTELAIRGQGTYTSIESVKAGYGSGDLSSANVHAIVSLWTELYGLDADRSDELIEEILEGFEEDAEQE